MLTDPYDEHWLERLNVPPEAKNLYLLVDGAFVPGLHRHIKAAVPSTDTPMLLFENLPGCNDKARDVSPFLVRYRATNPALDALLAKCSGYPMISAIETIESQIEVVERLAAWSVVQVDGQHFNFRFPDTRRLQGIFDALTSKQRSEVAGPATRWSYIDRSGVWRELAVPGTPSQVAIQPALNDQQFAAIVRDSEIDEVIAMLQHRGHVAEQHSRCYSSVSRALKIARKLTLDSTAKVSWCERCLLYGLDEDETQAATQFSQWASQASSANQESLT